MTVGTPIFYTYGENVRFYMNLVKDKELIYSTNTTNKCDFDPGILISHLVITEHGEVTLVIHPLQIK